MRTADDDSVPVPHDEFRLPRPVLTLRTSPSRVVAWRPLPDELEPDEMTVSRVDTRSGSHASSDEDDDPTRAMIQKPVVPRTLERSDAPKVLLARDGVHLDAVVVRAAKLWRDGPLRTVSLVAGSALITYLSLGGVQRDSYDPTQAVRAPAAAPPAAAPILVEQLNVVVEPLHEARRPSQEAHPPSREARQSLQTLQIVAALPHGEQSDKPRRRSAGSRAHATSFATAKASKSNGSQATVPAQSTPESSWAERSTAAVSSNSAGLPAWGADALQDFSSGKTGPAAGAMIQADAPAAQPASADADIPPPMASYRPGAGEQNSAAPVVAAKPAEPPKPEAPPPPSKPLTMEQVLNQVEEAAQARRKQTGLQAPKPTKRDAELEELINGAMKSKTK